MIARRTAALACMLVLFLASTACGATQGRSVTVLASWTGQEEQAFRSVLDAFQAETGITVYYQGTRAVDEVLAADVQAGTPPDVAILPSPARLARYARAGTLVPLDGVVGHTRGQYSPSWQSVERLGKQNIFAVPVKADLKSIVWYRTAQGPGPVATLDDLITESSDPRGAQQPWCLGMSSPPASGWPGTDWIEDILLHQSGPDVYQRWASGDLAWQAPEVRRAWVTWARMLGLPDRDRSARALFTDFSDASSGMLADPPRCRFEHLGSFASASLRSDGDLRPGAVDYIPFPAAGGVSVPPIVSADLAAMFTDTPAGRALLDFLADERGQRIWPALPKSGAFSANLSVADAGSTDEVRERIARTLATQPACYDASDAMAPEVASAFNRAVLEFLDDPGRLDLLLARLDTVGVGLLRTPWPATPCGTTPFAS